MARELPKLSRFDAAERLGDAEGFEVPSVSSLDSDELHPSAIGCVQALEAIRQAYPDRVVPLAFDADLAFELHSRARFHPVESTEVAFWRWLAIEHGQDLVRNRHGDNAGRANYGLGNRWLNLFERSWFRAELSFDPGLSNPYSLTKRGGSDFWASGVIRHRYSSARNMVRALIRFQFPFDDPFKGRMGTDDVRELYKRLSRMHASVAFELLTDEECGELLVELTEDLQ